MSKKREKVMVFEGEHSFVKPRDHSYDAKTGKAEYIGGDGTSTSDTTSTTTQAPPTTIAPSPPATAIVIPDDCNALLTFISTRGGGMASPDDVMLAYNKFQVNCNQKTTTSTTTSTTTAVTTAAPLPNDGNVTVVPNVPTVAVIAPPVYTNLGKPPVSLKKSATPEGTTTKKKNYLLLALGVLAIGYLLISNKKKG